MFKDERDNDERRRKGKAIWESARDTRRNCHLLSFLSLVFAVLGYLSIESRASEGYFSQWFFLMANKMGDAADREASAGEISSMCFSS